MVATNVAFEHIILQLRHEQYTAYSQHACAVHAVSLRVPVLHLKSTCICRIEVHMQPDSHAVHLGPHAGQSV